VICREASVAPLRGGVVQRCSCGAKLGAGGECEECRRRREVLGPERVPEPAHTFGSVDVHRGERTYGQQGSGHGQAAGHARSPVEDARRAASIRCQTAYLQLAGVVPPGPFGDRGEEARLRARSLVLKIFRRDLNMDQVTEIVGHMRDRLLSNVATVTAGARDPDCGNREAYVRGLRPPIVLCPAFFRAGPDQQARTMVHEAAHLAGIGEAIGESYCMTFDCESSCGGFDVADSWAHLVHCLSGRPPDKAETVTAPGSAAPSRPGGGGRKP